MSTPADHTRCIQIATAESGPYALLGHVISIGWIDSDYTVRLRWNAKDHAGFRMLWHAMGDRSRRLWLQFALPVGLVSSGSSFDRGPVRQFAVEAFTEVWTDTDGTGRFSFIARA